MARVAIVSAENLASSLIMRGLIDNLGHEISLVLMVPNMSVDNSKRRERAWRLIANASFLFIVFKLIEIYLHSCLAFIQRRTIWQYARDRGINIRRYKSVSDPAFLSDLAAHKPDYLLSAGPAIITKGILAIPRLATLNCHGARLPEYRGAANYIWMLLHNEPIVYTTIQQMEHELDVGPVLAEQGIVVDPSWSAYRLNYEVSRAGGQLYAQTTLRLLNGEMISPIQRPEAPIGNRGIPKRDDMRRFVAEGKRLFRPLELFRLV